ncbi:MAG: hydrogenase maturation protease, partial [Alphaproteobacteria bacterium]|nr:hydrogenase maturation protease [Alphaproteobacteria bacterium]
MTNVSIEDIPWIIGAGNSLRGDDAAAALVVAHLRSEGIPAVAFDGDGAELMESWMGQDRVIL